MIKKIVTHVVWKLERTVLDVLINKTFNLSPVKKVTSPVFLFLHFLNKIQLKLFLSNTTLNLIN